MSVTQALTPRRHPATAKAEVRAMLAIDRVLTTAQLERRGLLAAAGWLGLPTRTYSQRVCSTQWRSEKVLTFVCRDEDIAARPPRELMHYAGVAEVRVRQRLSAAYPAHRWRHVDDRRHGEIPDAEALHLEDPRKDVAIEFDAGYSTLRVKKKVVAFDESYAGVYWGTSCLGRVRNVHKVISGHTSKQLAHLDIAVVCYVDFWTPGPEAYVLSARNRKPQYLLWERPT